MQFFTGKYVIENVIPYYKPLIHAQEVACHYFWSNFPIHKYKTDSRCHFSTVEELQIKGQDKSVTVLTIRRSVPATRRQSVSVS